MAIIKGWIKGQEFGKRIEYKHVAGSRVFVDFNFHTSDKGTWDVVYYKPRTNKYNDVRHFKTKTQALKYARSFMKRHPRG